MCPGKENLLRTVHFLERTVLQAISAKPNFTLKFYYQFLPMISYLRLFSLCLALVSPLAFLHAQSGTITQTSFVGQPSFDLAVGGGYLYVHPTGPSVIPLSLSNPEVPASQPTVNYSGNANAFVDYANGYLFGAGGVGNIFRVFDLSNPAAPSFLASVPVSALNVRAVASINDYSFLGSSDTVFVVDHSTKSAPVVSGSVSGGALSGGSITDIEASGDYLYVATTTSLAVLDISSPANPTVLSAVSGITSCTSVSVDATNNLLYAGGSSGFNVCDITTPTSVSVIGSGSGANANGRLKYSAGFILQADQDNSSSQGVSGFFANGGTPQYIDTFVGTVGFSINGKIEAQDSVFYVSKFGGIEAIKLETIVGLDEGPQLSFDWYPNPAGEQARLRLPDGMTEAHATIYGIQGQIILDMELASDETQIELGQLAPGAYLIEVSADNYRPTRKVILID